MKYSLQRKSYTQAIVENFPNTLKSIAGFVTCSSITGLGFGIIHSMNITEFSLESDERIIPTIAAFGAVYYAKKIYDNFKKERARVHQLALEIDKERARRYEAYKKELSEFKTPEQLNNMQYQNNITELKEYRDQLINNQSEGVTQGKRKALNNGIFKANDNY